MGKFGLVGKWCRFKDCLGRDRAQPAEAAVSPRGIRLLQSEPSPASYRSDSPQKR